MATTADIKNGLCIDLNGEPFQIIEFLHVKPGKGNAFVRTKLRNLNNGRVLEHTFPSGAKLDVIRIEYRNFQFLYKDGDGYHFMDMNDFNQITLPEEVINAPEFLMDGMECIVMYHADEDRPLACNLPSSVTMEVVYAEPAVKGNTATNATKVVKVESGAEIRVPLFIEQGEKIIINPETKEYKGRAN